MDWKTAGLIVAGASILLTLWLIYPQTLDDMNSRSMLVTAAALALGLGLGRLWKR